jgi:hypothetical protein
METPVPSETLTPQPPQEFDPVSVQTFTPSSPAHCPKENASLEFDAEKATDFSGSNLNQPQEHEQFIKNILGHLNSGGTPKSVIMGFSKQYSYSFEKIIYEQDITGDNIPELIIPYGIRINVLGCKDGSYELMFSDTYESDLNGAYILDVTDINRDSIVEVVVWFDGCLGGRCPIIRVYEWNGKDFQNLIANPFDIGSGCSSLSVAPFEVKIRDTDNNGTKEIILSNNGFVHPDIDFPYRKETRICMWNGQNFVVYKTEFDAPYYRFQAVQDGDRATFHGDYDRALISYQQAIDDKGLEWFTLDRKRFDFWMYHSQVYSFEPTPTASPSLTPDPNEYPILAAYAYYRIMLVYVLQHDTLGAESILNTLQKDFPEENPGNYFTQVASVFWQEYQLSMNVQSSCQKVIDYAQQHSLPTKYLGDWDHGAHSIHYTPEAICPLR